MRRSIFRIGLATVVLGLFGVCMAAPVHAQADIQPWNLSLGQRLVGPSTGAGGFLWLSNDGLQDVGFASSVFSITPDGTTLHLAVTLYHSFGTLEMRIQAKAAGNPDGTAAVNGRWVIVDGLLPSGPMLHGSGDLTGALDPANGILILDLEGSNVRIP